MGKLIDTQCSESRMRKILKRGLAAVLLLSFAAPAFAWWNDGWSYRTKINLSPQAAGVTGTIGRTPVLVRLHSGNFDFADAAKDGSDLRFVAADDRTPLAFHFERWSPAEQVALVWVDAPSLVATAASAIYVYYGAEKPAAGGGQNAAGTYAPELQLVWHFDGTGAPRDTTSHGNNAINDAGRRNAGGLIGQSVALEAGDGIGLPAATIAAGQPMTASMWIRPTAQGLNGQLLDVPGIAVLALAAGVPYIEAGGQRSSNATPLAADAWAHVAMSVSKDAMQLYINGKLVSEVAASLLSANGTPAASLVTEPSEQANDAAAASANPNATGAMLLGRNFAGQIDELRIYQATVPASALALAAASEGQGARLLTFETAEQTDAGGHNYFGILFAALTLDAWIVIVILGIMAVLSWWVMATKGLFIGRTARANEDFLDDYREVVAGRAIHQGLGEHHPTTGKSLEHQDSPLSRLFAIAQRELNQRLSESGRAETGHAVAPQSIAAIRSALDAGQVREGQRLNKWMVLLTIAISGGPFIGLLGTVLGVMITFAAVAAAGDVNINAIAPGIAAALLATVAGLAVAIPALFGYNYLLSRIDEIAADMQIFVDELEKRIAETYRGDAATSMSTR